MKIIKLTKYEKTTKKSYWYLNIDQIVVFEQVIDNDTPILRIWTSGGYRCDVIESTDSIEFLIKEIEKYQNK